MRDLNKVANPLSTHNKGFILLAVLIVVFVVSIGSINLISFSGTQQKLIAMNQLKILLKQEAENIANEIIYFINDEKSFYKEIQLWDHACNHLPDPKNPIKRCVTFNKNCSKGAKESNKNTPVGCHLLHMSMDNSKKINIYPKKSVTWVYLNPIPVRGTMNEYHHLYRLDVTLAYDDIAVTLRSNIGIDRLGS